MKYVINQTDTGVYVPVIGPEHANHSDIAIRGLKVISAGRLTIKDDTVIVHPGKCSSLGISTVDPGQDQQILTSLIQEAGMHAFCDFTKVWSTKFLEYFPLPWKSDQCVYIWSSNNTTPLQLFEQQDIDPSDILNVVANIINGDTEGTFHNATYNPETQEITVDKHNTLIVRGWGYLKGVHKLSDYTAAKIQDSMGEWVAAKLAGKA